MASVQARKLPPKPSTPGSASTIVSDAYPSWRSLYPQELLSFSTKLGVTTQWLVGTTLRKSLTTSLDLDLPVAVCLSSVARWNESRGASLCVGLPDSLHLYTPSERVLEIPLPACASPLARLSGLFPVHKSLVLELSTEAAGDVRRRYYALLDPLEEPLLLPEFDEKDRIIFSSPDAPLIVTHNQRYIKVWSAFETPPESAAVFSPSKLVEKARRISLSKKGMGPSSTADLCPVVTTLQMQLVHIQTEDVHRGSDPAAFLAHDMRGRLVLCLVASGTLTVLGFGVDNGTVDNVAVVYRVEDVVHAVPILGVRRGNNALDTLVQHASGELSLYVGPHRVCEVALSSRQKKTDGVAKVAQRKKRILMSESFDVFSVRFGNGTSFRYSLEEIAFRSPLVCKCMAAISFAFDETDCLTQMVPLYQKSVMMLAKSANPSGLNFDGEWDMFVNILLSNPCGGDKLFKDVQLDDNSEISDWEFLSRTQQVSQQESLSLLPKMWLQNAVDEPPRVVKQTLSSEEMLISMRILKALHLIYEDKKLNVLLEKEVKQLARANRRIALHVGSTSYLDYYRRELGSAGSSDSENQILASRDSHLLDVPSIFDHLVRIVKGQHISAFSDLGFASREKNQSNTLLASGDAECPTALSKHIEHYYCCLFGKKGEGKTSSQRAEMVLLAMVKHGFERRDLEALPFGVALPLQDALLLCRKAPNRAWGPEAFFLTGREDLLPSALNNRRLKYESPATRTARANLALLRLQAVSASDSSSAQPQAAETEGSSSSTAPSKDADDGCGMDGLIFSLRFGQDRRLEEVRRMLRCTVPIIVSPKAEPGAEGEPTSQEFQAKLALFVRKRLASPIGRGAFTLRTFLPADPTKPLTVPNMCMTGHLLGQKFAKISLADPALVPMDWGEFHNGVACGLRLVAPNPGCDSDNVQVLTRSWIVRHKPTKDSLSSSHAGMLLALGLGGFLPALKTTDHYQYLLPRHDLTSIGLMLGLASGRRGSMETKITKILRLHIRGFNENGFSVADFSVPVIVQTAAVISLGLVYECCPKPLVLDGLFKELTRCARFGNDVDDREGLALASGIAIGIVCLGMGEPLVSISNGKLVDRLACLANGEQEGPPDAITTREATGSPKSTQENNAADSDRAGMGGDSDACRLVEMSSLNVDVVVPGALLALGLMYLKTNDVYVANRIRVPKNFYDLDRVRPDHVFLQILARSMILWDRVQPTVQWVMDCLPSFLQPLIPDDDAQHWDLLANIGREKYGQYINPDMEGILCARAFGIAGACTSLALRFAGANDSRVTSILTKACVSFENALVQVKKDSQNTEYMYSTCLASCALALGVASAGSGDLDVFRLLRRVRKRGGPSLKEQRYGKYMAMDMAVGFLFLGGGCQTLGTSNIAIASLICSIFPKFPADVIDNRYHLQALRHLYVLAVEPRCIETRDVDTDTPCEVDIEVVTKSNEVQKLKAPCIVPSTDVVKHICVVSERYWPTSVELNVSSGDRGWYSATQKQILYVKRRPGHLSHRADPKGSKGILARSLCRTRPSSKSGSSMEIDDMEHLVRAFSADPEILAFARKFCAPRVDSSGTGGTGPGTNDGWRRYSQVLCEYLANDRSEALRCFFDAERAVSSIHRRQATPAVLGSMRVAQEYFDVHRCSEAPLVTSVDLGYILHQARDVVWDDAVLSAAGQYITSGGSIWPDGPVEVALGYAIRWYGVPQPVDLQRLTSALRRNAKGALTVNDIWMLCVTNLPADCSEHAIEYISKALLQLQKTNIYSSTALLP